MTENHITHIISVCADPIPGEVPASGICHMRIPVEDVDYADLLIHLPSACQFIDRALRSGGVVFVHCVQGISRSAAVVAAYCRLSIFIFQLTSFHPKHAVMWSRRIHSTEALNIVRNGRHILILINGAEHGIFFSAQSNLAQSWVSGTTCSFSTL